ncbi:hypothetical protein GCT19_04170 [Paraburkholderia sp. CNPSo 3155]|uniref:hypothetical protein n=1 Tax=Paraburkholderia atlantica TaxID=2654982 RepID=UPI00128D21F3|nr:hypothetical protein [Paraburkholderia atlantica]MPW04852.1 hypothetical protein [Paraburkholderia atlantica]
MPDADAAEVLLRAWCAENGHRIGPLGDVGEPVAAALLNLSPSGLRMQVQEGRSRIRPCSISPHGWRRYLLRDIAAQIAQDAQNALEW